MRQDHEPDNPQGVWCCDEHLKLYQEGRLFNRQQDWCIQQVNEEGAAPFLLYKGVLVGRLYGGCPYEEMLIKLNAPDPIPQPPKGSWKGGGQLDA